MPQPVTFEEAISRLQQANPGMTHGRALSQMQEWHDAGDPEVRAIPDIAGKLKIAALSGFANNLAEGITSTLGAPVRSMAQMVAAGTGPGALHRGAETAAEALSPEESAKVTSQVEPSPVGRLAGEGIGLGISAEQMSPFARMIPGLGGTGKLASAGRGAVETLGLQQGGELGDMSPPAALAFGAATPLVTRPLGRLATRVFGRSAEAVPEAAEDIVSSPFKAPEPQPGPFTRQGEYEAPSEAKPSKIEPIGSGGIRAGRPFEVRTHVRTPSNRQGLDIWGDPNNPVFGQGPAYPMTFKKPLILDVPSSGEDGWIHAATSLNADDPEMVEALRNAKDPVGMAQELIARKARAGGFDSVNLSTPDITNNVIMGIDPKWKPSPHPDIGPKLTRFRKKVPSPFAQAQPKLGDQIASVKDEVPIPTKPDLEKLSAKGRANMIRKAKNPDPQVHAQGDPDLADQVKWDGAVTNNSGAYEPEVQQARSYIKRRGGLNNVFAPMYASDDVEWNRLHQNVMTEHDLGEAFATKQKELYKGLRKDFPDIFVKDEAKAASNFDELARAQDGLGWDRDKQKYVQNALNVEPRYDKAARRLAEIGNNDYTRLTGNDAKVWHILEERGLPHSRYQLERLRAIQEADGPKLARGSRPWSEKFDKVYEDLTKRPIKPEEFFAAQDLAGMLKFDFTHDLDFEPTTGFLRFQPHANERAMLEDAIKQYKSLGEAGKPPTFEDQTRIEDAIKRINYLEDKVLKDQMRRAPAQDFIPKRKWASSVHVSKDPEARPFFYDNNPDHVIGTYITSHNNKRTADVTLAYARRLLKNDAIPGSLKDRAVDFANVVRGSTGFRADSKWAEQINNIFRLNGTDHEMTPHEIHKFVSTIQDYVRITYLEFTPFRFPVINLTHSFPTTLAVGGYGNFARGLARTLGDATASHKLAYEEGILSEDSEWLKDISGRQSALSNLKVTRALRYLTWKTENFRKVLAHQTGLAAARAGEYSKVVRGFVMDPKEYANETQRQLAYARAFTKATQFELSNVGKPLGFSSGSMWGVPLRGATQFKSWSSGLGGLWAEMIRQKEYGMFAKSMTAAAFFGGGAVAAPFGAYEFARREALKHGLWLPEKPGYAYLLHALGQHDNEMIIPTLSDPLGTSIYNPTSLAGPAIGKLLDAGSTIVKDIEGGQTYKLPSDIVRDALGPEVGAGLQMYQEILKGGVFNQGGVLARNRPLYAMVARGVDLQPSVATQHKNYLLDLEAAALANDKTNFQAILAEAQRRGFVFDKSAQRQLRSYIYQHKRGEMTPWQVLP